MWPPPVKPWPGWGQALYTGVAGIALAHIADAHAGTGDWHSAHQWVTAMVRRPVTAHPDGCGLDRGAPAVAFVLHTAGRPAYAPALARLDQHIDALTRHRLRTAHHRIDTRQLAPLREYDLIRGLTGIGAHLLHRHGNGDLLHSVLSYLVRLTHPLTVDGQTLPGWWTSDAPTGRPSPDWPGGHANLGIAHGIAGPLALLAAAMRHGITVAGHADAIARICGWLDQWRTGDGTQAWWPATLTRAEHTTGTLRQAGPGRPSWCYGTPGLARAQQLAGLALADPQRRRLAEDALAGSLADPAQLAQLGDASLCHGWAGLVQTTRRVAADATDPDRYDLPALLRHTEQFLRRHGPPAAGGLLDGQAGLRLTRHTATATACGWDACLLLAGTPLVSRRHHAVLPRTHPPRTTPTVERTP